jgi:hypothetical protein
MAPPELSQRWAESGDVGLEYNLATFSWEMKGNEGGHWSFLPLSPGAGHWVLLLKGLRRGVL